MVKVQGAAQLRGVQIDIIRRTIVKCFDVEQGINYDEFIYRICERFHVTRRTAVEYIKTAMISISYEVVTIDGVDKLKGHKVKVLRSMSAEDKKRNKTLNYFEDSNEQKR